MLQNDKISTVLSTMVLPAGSATSSFPEGSAHFTSTMSTTMTSDCSCLLNNSFIKESWTSSTCSMDEVIQRYGCIRTDEDYFLDKVKSLTDPRFYCEGVSISVLGIIGLFGNLLALIVLSRPNLRDVFHQLLFAVASFDLMYIVVGGVNYTFKAFHANSDVYVYLYPHIIHPFTHIAATGVIYMTVAITIERYLGLCHPFLPPTSRKAWFYVLPVAIIAVAMNIPKFLEIEHNWEDITSRDTNETVEVISYRSTSLRYKDNYYIGYRMWTRLFSDGIIPVIILVYLNTRIIVALISATKVQRFNSARRQRKEINLTIILLFIVFIFFFCHAARIVLDVYEFVNLEKVLACRRLGVCERKPFIYLPNNIFFFLPVISHMMQILNSSTNFIVYCLVGQNFRRELCRAFGIRKYSSVPNNLRSTAYDHSTFANQGFASRKESRNSDDNKESKKKDLEVSNGKSTTATMSPPSYKSCTEMNGVSGHKNHTINRLAPELLHLNSLGPQNSFPLAPISTSIST